MSTVVVALLAGYLSAHASMTVALRGRTHAPKATCGIKVVGVHFEGHPGQTFHYDAADYTIPHQGWIEVVAGPAVYSIDGKEVVIEGTPLDEFGFRRVPLPTFPQLNDGGRK